MVKKSAMRSPRKPVKVGVEVEVPEVEGGQVGDNCESESNADENETWHDARDKSLLSPTKEANYLQQHIPVATMGNDQSTETMSKEELNAAIRTRAQDLRKANSGVEVTGKLKRPSTRVGSLRPHNPDYRNPLASAQRQLPPATRPRSTYDLEVDPATTLDPPKAPWTDSRPKVSPRKADKRRARKAVAEATVGADEEPETTEHDVPRTRSTRSLALARDPPRAGVEEVSPEVQIERAVEPIDQREDDADAGAKEEDSDENNINVADRDTNATEEDGVGPRGTTEDETKHLRKRGRGRPRKTPNTGAEESPRTTKQGGRPSTSSNVAAERGLTRSEVTTLKTRLRNVHAQAESTTNPATADSSVPTRSTQPKPKKGKKQSAVEGLNKRRSQGDEEDLPDNDAAEAGEAAKGGENDEEADDLSVPSSSQEPVEQQAERVRLSELGYSESVDEDEDENSTPLNRSKKRKADSQAATANSGRKIKRSKQLNHPDGTEAAEDNEDNGSRRLFGQWPAFLNVLKKSKQIGCSVKDGARGNRNYVDLEDRDVEETIKLCDGAIHGYTALGTHAGPSQPKIDLLELLNKVADRVDGLRGKHDEFETDWEDESKAEDIYYHLVPKLLTLVKASILCYEALDTRPEGQGQVNIGHLRTVIHLMTITLDLVKSAQKYPRPSTDLHVVQPVRELVPTLRDIRNTLNRQVQMHEFNQQARKQREQERIDRIAREEEKAEREKQEAVTQRLRQKWQRLHTERMLAEGGLMPPSKRRHLAIPDEYHTEFDHNGIPFQREEIFHPRVGPPPDMVEAAMNLEWSLVELSALSDGLKAYTGEHVFERMIRRYCGRARELNKYNVTEIVAVAVMLKQSVIADQRKKFGDVEQWVLDIPVWTRSHHGEGQENMDEVADEEGELAMSGDAGEA